MMTNQEIFNKVKAHLLKQGARATRDGAVTGACWYRGDNGTSCAVGCLIPDDKYVPEIELFGVGNHAVMALMTTIVGGDIYDRGEKYNLLIELQGLHDNCPPHTWPGELDRLADEFGLNK